MKQKILMLLTCLFMGSGLVFAQNVTVQGVVTSEEDGQPVVGASVAVVGTTLGTITDLDGKFSIANVPTSAKNLKVSYIGMATQEIIIKQGVMRIVLKPDAALLEEVVVLGYGSGQKLGSVVGTVTRVKSETFEKKPVANAGDALQGQVAGLQVFTPGGEPTQGVQMRLRGVSSLMGSSEPLFILDGAPITSAVFTALNPNDIESMTVLKDASSSAIYGARAANGVIIITSKIGKRGEKSRVTVSAQFGFSQKTGDRVTMMNAEQWLNLQELIDPSMKTNQAFQTEKRFYIDNGISTNWSDIFFGKSAPMQQYDISASGGSENLSYLISFSHYDSDGIMDDSSLRRETLRSNVDASITKWLKVGVNLGLSYQKYTTALFGTTSNSVYNKAYAARIYRPDQTYYEILKDKDGNFIGYGDRLELFSKMNYYNPYYLSELQPNIMDLIRVNGNTYINLSPIKGLNIRAQQAADAFDYRSSYKAIPEGPFEGNGTVREAFQRFYNFTFSNTIEYKFSPWFEHSIVALVGQEAIISKDQYFRAIATGLTDKRLMLLSAGAQASIQDNTISEEVFNSYFATLDYDYADKYHARASFRRDGSSLFGQDVQWGNFWSAGLMWNLKKENFLRDVDWLDELQIRGSYGEVGNVSALEAYKSLGLIGTGPLYDGKAGVAVSNPANPNLTWETVKSTNIALTTRVFDRLKIELEFYNRVTDHMLLDIPYSYTTGFASGWGNVGNLRNRGIDITANVDILKNVHGIDWSFTANVNYNKNTLTKLFNGIDEYVLSSTGLKLQVDKPFGEFYYVRWAGVDPRDGYNMWYDKNGNLTKVFSEDDAVFTGKQRYAPWSGGFGTSISWKGITLSADFSFMLGQYMLNNERWFTENPQFAVSNNQTVDMLTIWQKPGDITRISTPESPMQFDTHLLENASFMRMKNLSVSYVFPKRWMNKTGFMQNVKVFFVGRNLLTVTKYRGFDPEINSNIQMGNYPNTKQFSFGIELGF